MRVLLVGVPGFHTQTEPVFPLGIGYLIASLRGSGHVVRGVYFILEEHMNEALPEFIRKFNPDLVGFSCNTFNRGTVKRGIQLVKSINPSVKIVVGGVHATYLYFQMISDYGADYVVIGEGERTFPELCRMLDSGDSPLTINGIAYRNGNSIVYGKREPIVNLDDLPVPDYSFARDLIMSANMGFTITSRGCPVRCTFCSTGSYWGQKVRKHSPERVLDELEKLVSEFGVSRIFFHDDTFNLGVDRTLAICKGIADRGLKIDWGVSCRVVPVTPEMIEAMVETGCKHICWGIETGSPEMMRQTNKKISFDQIRYAYSLCEPYSRQGRLSTGAFMMVGFPGESDQTIQESIDFLNTIPLTDAPSPAAVYVLPGTQLWEDQRVINESYWVETDAVLYINMITGVSPRELTKWGVAICNAGKRVPFDNDRHFWNGVIKGKIPIPKCPTV